MNFKYIFSLSLCLCSTVIFAQEVKIDAAGFQTFEMTEGDTTYVMKQYFFGLIKKGPIRNQPDEALAKLQTAHLSYMDQIQSEGKLDIAGPFGGDTDNQGLVIYNVPSYEEAKSLANNDPMVLVGRLVIEVLPLWAAQGSSLK